MGTVYYVESIGLGVGIDGCRAELWGWKIGVLGLAMVRHWG
jgi:hypothetical protein